MNNKNSINQTEVGVVSCIDILAPISGNLVPLQDVPEKVFAEKIVGDGVAISPTDNVLYAPITGTLAKIFDNNHAFSIKNHQGLELFIHFGIGTVELGGQGFIRLKEEGCNVTAGEAIIQVDITHVAQQVESIVTPVVVANMEDINSISYNSGKVTAAQDVIFTITL